MTTAAEKLSHEWVIAAYVPVDAQGAAYARRRGVYRVPATTKVSSAEVMCIHCRKPYDEALHTECPGSDPTLHGGPVGTRKRRTPEAHPTVADTVPAARLASTSRTRRTAPASHTGTLSSGVA
ncbi:hypothetical protein [Kitasatospora cinereorecta]|uniref:Uncharacterized protein n=1 Tax=Kitasatospora cinereorecta TaxID=285560 RepID=A0ABW0V8S7_9ACTN